MRWKTKSKVQNLVSKLPGSLSYAAYFRIHRHFGALRSINPTGRLRAAVRAWQLIRRVGHDPAGKTFFEVGTGWVPTVPLAYWLMGAKRTTTIDLNRYMRTELVVEALAYISRHQDDIREIFGPLLDIARFDALIEFFAAPDFSVDGVLELAGITYIAPADAANTGLLDGSFDYHTSFNVLEHIPTNTLEKILSEGNRLINSGGLFVHHIDYTDHFAHSDKRISTINFLQFSDAAWRRYAGNRFMYMNRLRHDDYQQLFELAQHELVLQLPEKNTKLAAVLARNDFHLDDRFKAKSRDLLLTTGAWFISRDGSG